MFSGDTQRLEICCHNSILEEILDRFGQNGEIKKSSEPDRFNMITKSIVSDGLVSWIMQFGDKIKVISPESLKKDIINKANSISELYCNNENNIV